METNTPPPAPKAPAAAPAPAEPAPAASAPAPAAPAVSAAPQPAAATALSATPQAPTGATPPPIEADGAPDVEILKLLGRDDRLLDALSRIAAGADRDATLRQLIAPAAPGPGIPVGSPAFLQNIRPDFWE